MRMCIYAYACGEAHRPSDASDDQDTHAGLVRQQLPGLCFPEAASKKIFVSGV